MIQHRAELYKLFNRPIRAVEIGVAEGNFSDDMLKWPNLEHLFMVDRWASVPSQAGDASFPQSWHDANYRRVVGRMLKNAGRFTILRHDSVYAATLIPDNSLDLVYVDGDHSLAGVRADILAWFLKLKTGGVMAFHDYENPAYGVKKAVDEWCKGWIEIHVLSENGDPMNHGAYFIC